MPTSITCRYVGCMYVAVCGLTTNNTTRAYLVACDESPLVSTIMLQPWSQTTLIYIVHQHNGYKLVPLKEAFQTEVQPFPNPSPVNPGLGKALYSMDGAYYSASVPYDCYVDLPSILVTSAQTSCWLDFWMLGNRWDSRMSLSPDLYSHVVWRQNEKLQAEQDHFATYSVTTTTLKINII